MTRQQIHAYTRAVGDAEARHRIALERLQIAEGARIQTNSALQAALEGQGLAQEVAAAVQEHTHAQIAGVVSRCLEAVFGAGAYAFRVTFARARGRTEARLAFVHPESGEEVDPATACEGGAVDVAAFALRLACLLLHRPAPRRLLVLDEPFRFLHGAEYRERLRELLLTLSEELGVQVVMVTGVPEFCCGNVIDLDHMTRA